MLWRGARHCSNCRSKAAWSQYVDTWRWEIPGITSAFFLRPRSSSVTTSYLVWSFPTSLRKVSLSLCISVSLSGTRLLQMLFVTCSTDAASMTGVSKDFAKTFNCAVFISSAQLRNEKMVSCFHLLRGIRAPCTRTNKRCWRVGSRMGRKFLKQTILLIHAVSYSNKGRSFCFRPLGKSNASTIHKDSFD